MQYERVLVTGADGFIGSHLTERLVREGKKVRALCYYNSFNYRGWLEGVAESDNLEIVAGDIRDPYFCQTLVKDIDCIFHLAALIAIPYSYIAPDNYVDTNIKGTMNICQAALKEGCQRIIHTSTSEVYGTAQYVPIDEKHPLQPQSPYSASKIGADNMAMSFFNSFDLPLTIARPFNTFGPRQSARAVIPAMAIQLLNGAKKIKVGDLTPTRDFNFVEDTCDGFIALANSERTIGETCNIGSGVDISIKETFELIKKLTKSEVEFIEDPQRIRPQKSEVFQLQCDCTKLKQLTGYQQKYTFAEGLAKTIDWFANPDNLKLYKAGIYNV